MKNKYLLFFILGLLFSSCGVILEDDLSKIKVEVIAPPDGYSINIQTQELIWEEHELVDSFRVEIVADSFSYVLRYVLDTIVYDNRLTVTLIPDHYQWRVKGINNSSETDFDIQTLIITQDTTLSSQSLNLILPAQDDVYLTDSVGFFWDELLFAQNYQLQLATNPSFNSQLIVEDVMTPNDFYYLVNELGTGDYYWRLRALRNNVDTTDWSAAVKFNVNAIPDLSAPADGSTVNLPLQLSWNSGSNILRDSLYIYYENEATPFLTRTSTTEGYTFVTSDTTGKGAGNYYWEVRSLSNSNYLSDYSVLRNFVVN